MAFTRRDFLKNGAALVTAGVTVPAFLARTMEFVEAATATNKILVIVQLAGGKARDLTLGQTVQHGGVRRRRFGPEVAVLRGKVPEILGNRLHGIERVVEPFQRAAEGPVRDGQDLAFTGHDWTAFRLADRTILHLECPNAWTDRGNLMD